MQREIQSTYRTEKTRRCPTRPRGVSQRPQNTHRFASDHVPCYAPDPPQNASHGYCHRRQQPLATYDSWPAHLPGIPQSPKADFSVTQIFPGIIEPHLLLPQRHSAPFSFSKSYPSPRRYQYPAPNSSSSLSCRRPH